MWRRSFPCRGFLFLYSLLAACSSGSRPSAPAPTGLTGEELAKSYCGSCHLFPQPDLLDKASWKNGVLPEMAYRLGMRPMTDKLRDLDVDELRDVLRSRNYPDHPILAAEDWQKIIGYYTQNAPDHPLPQAAKAPVRTGLPFFEVRSISVAGGPLPMATMVKIDSTDGRLYVFRREKGELEIYDKRLRKIDSIRCSSPVTDMFQLGRDSCLVLQIGIMEPNESRKGKLLLASPGHRLTTVIDSLKRPVNLTVRDLNGDGTPDYLICNFGNETGSLSWYDGVSGKEHILSQTPGARNTTICDLNGDGLPDILALMCQAQERISVWYNRGNGNFEEQALLRFPPVYGSSYFTLADMNGDGFPDIVYTNGDNADYSYSLKRYHGLHIFLNDGQNNFTERFFYPVYGAETAVVCDFDHDGDPDIALTAFFTDPRQQPDEGFLCFENKGNMRFDVSTFNGSGSGRWLVMDAGDLDGDGRQDLVLGSFMKPGLGQNSGSRTKAPLSIVWLRNTVPVKTRSKKNE